MTIHLSIVLFLPLAYGSGRRRSCRARLARWAVLAGTLAVLAYVVVDARRLRVRRRAPVASRTTSGSPSSASSYKLGVDGLNLFMIALTAIAWVPCTLVAAFTVVERPRLFFFNLALAETAVLGAFMAQDLALFIVFFDLMLVPFYFLIGGWGSGERVRATTKFVIYTLSGSLLMMAAAIALGVLATPDGGEISFSLSDLQQRIRSPEGSQHWIVLLFALAFFVKAPLFPLHGWVPETYRSTSIPVLALLSGVLSKVGVYGFLRIVLPVMPDGAAVLAGAVHHHRGLLDPLRVDPGVLAGQRAAWCSRTRRSRSSGSSCWASSPSSEKGAQGALFQMLNHGLVTVPLFLILGVIAAARPRERVALRARRHGVQGAGAGGAVPGDLARDARDARARATSSARS